MPRGQSSLGEGVGVRPGAGAPSGPGEHLAGWHVPPAGVGAYRRLCKAACLGMLHVSLCVASLRPGATSSVQAAQRRRPAGSLHRNNNCISAAAAP